MFYRMSLFLRLNTCICKLSKGLVHNFGICVLLYILLYLCAFLCLDVHCMHVVLPFGIKRVYIVYVYIILI